MQVHRPPAPSRLTPLVNAAVQAAGPFSGNQVLLIQRPGRPVSIVVQDLFYRGLVQVSEILSLVSEIAARGEPDLELNTDLVPELAPTEVLGCQPGPLFTSAIGHGLNHAVVATLEKENDRPEGLNKNGFRPLLIRSKAVPGEAPGRSSPATGSGET
jgi:hypothetical protein